MKPRTKPRLRKVNGIWYCYVKAIGWYPYGMGFTPKESYADWMKRK